MTGTKTIIFLILVSLASTSQASPNDLHPERLLIKANPEFYNFERIQSYEQMIQLVKADPETSVETTIALKTPAAQGSLTFYFNAAFPNQVTLQTDLSVKANNGQVASLKYSQQFPIERHHELKFHRDMFTLKPEKKCKTPAQAKLRIFRIYTTPVVRVFCLNKKQWKVSIWRELYRDTKPQQLIEKQSKIIQNIKNSVSILDLEKIQQITENYRSGYYREIREFTQQDLDRVKTCIANDFTVSLYRSKLDARLPEYQYIQKTLRYRPTNALFLLYMDSNHFKAGAETYQFTVELKGDSVGSSPVKTVFGWTDETGAVIAITARDNDSSIF